MDIRKAEIFGYFEGVYNTLLKLSGDQADTCWVEALSLTLDKFTKLPIYRSAMQEVNKELSNGY